MAYKMVIGVFGLCTFLVFYSTFSVLSKTTTTKNHFQEESTSYCYGKVVSSNLPNHPPEAAPNVTSTLLQPPERLCVFSGYRRRCCKSRDKHSCGTYKFCPLCLSDTEEPLMKYPGVKFHSEMWWVEKWKSMPSEVCASITLT